MPDFPDAVSSEHLVDLHFTLDTPPAIVGAAPLGRRSIHLVKGGTFGGPRLRGTIRPGGGDWLLSYDGGHNELDVRATLETDDGALVYVQYRGVLKVDAADPANPYFRTQPRFETGHEKYKWLNTIVCVGYGAVAPGGVGYRIFAIT
jgi:hypothetical protein